MEESPSTCLVALLGGIELRNRTGLLLLPTTWLGREPEVAARLGTSCEDLREVLLQRLAPGQRYLGLDWRELIRKHLDGLVRGATPDGGCVLVANVDVALSSFKATERSQFWKFMRESYRPEWGLLLGIPAVTQRLMAEDELSLWTDAERLAIWEGGIEGP